MDKVHAKITLSIRILSKFGSKAKLISVQSLWPLECPLQVWAYCLFLTFDLLNLFIETSIKDSTVDTSLKTLFLTFRIFYRINNKNLIVYLALNDNMTHFLGNRLRLGGQGRNIIFNLVSLNSCMRFCAICYSRKMRQTTRPSEWVDACCKI